MKKELSCTIKLPEGFRSEDILLFHRRDPQELAEQVHPECLRKAMMWRGAPACLTIKFRPKSVAVELIIDSEYSGDDKAALKQMVERMLGLTQNIEQFERKHNKHPLLGRLIKKNAGLRVPLSATPFEALSWAIIGQQISVSAAVSIRRKLIQAAAKKHSSGLLCYPDSECVVAVGEQGLRGVGFSRTKAQTMIRLGALIKSGELCLDSVVDRVDVETLRSRLLAVKGIGPWTVNYTLLRGYGWLDGSLHGDVVVRRSLQQLMNKKEKLTEKETEQWLLAFSPWRALVAAHLWAVAGLPA